MIDNCSLVCFDWDIIKHLGPNYFEVNNAYQKIMNQENSYKLYNGKTGIDCHFLKIMMMPEVKKIIIIGSIRKWYYGASSLNDFSKNDLYECYQLLANLLSLEISDFLKFWINSIEIGLNITYNQNITLLFNKATRYKSQSYAKKTDENSIKFYTPNESIILYNKTEEIISQIKRKKIVKSDVEKEYLQKVLKPKKIIRVEIKFQGGKSKINEKIKIENLSELLENYNYLFDIYWKNVRKLEFGGYNKDLMFCPQKGTIKELSDFFMKYSLNKLGYEGINSLIMQLEKPVRRQAKRQFVKKLDTLNVSSINYKNLLLQRITIAIILLLKRDDNLGRVRSLFLDKL